MFRALPAALVAGALCLPLRAEPREIFDFVQKSCAGCHNPGVKSGDLDLKSLNTAETFNDERERWEKVVSKLKTRQMPPPGAPRPPDAEIASVTSWLEAE